MNTSNTASATSRGGLIILLAKLGPMLLTFVPKMLKTLFSFKAGLAIASTALYSSAYHSWTIGLLFVLALAVHEYGHVWAMKRCGLKTRGMYLIPGFGALAIADDHWKSARNEAYIAIMGPIFGTLFFVVPMLALYALTGYKVLAGIAGLAAFINLLNLFPVNPLDGGRMMKTFVHSMHEKIGFFIMLGIGVAGIALSSKLGFGLIAFVSVIGMIELLKDYGIIKMVPTTSRLVASVILTAALCVNVHFVVVKAEHWWSQTLGLIVGAFFFYVLVARTASFIKECPRRHGFWRGLGIGLSRFFQEFWWEWKDFSMDEVKRIDNYPPLSKKQLAIAVALYLFLSVSLVICIVAVSKVPGLDILKGVLQ